MSYTKPRDKPIRVLIADDDSTTLEFMDFAARSEGFTTVCVTTAQGIIDAFNQDQEGFDIIISDVNFLNDTTVVRPRLTGIAAVRQIRKAEDDIPVLFVSAYTNNILREEARRVGAQMLAKPINPNALFGDLNAIHSTGNAGMVRKLVEWHKASISEGYDGPERRVNSVNRTEHRRRKTDKQVESPTILKEIIREVREEEHKLICEAKRNN